MSFPYWERGLKSLMSTAIPFSSVSFPYWERGLKSEMTWMTDKSKIVVPLLGTWIEIREEGM